jgi:hypothetical protein
MIQTNLVSGLQLIHPSRKLELMGEYTCPRWHRDNYCGRGIITYNLSGTQYLPEVSWITSLDMAKMGSNEAINDWPFSVTMMFQFDNCSDHLGPDMNFGNEVLDRDDSFKM